MNKKIKKFLLRTAALSAAFLISLTPVSPKPLNLVATSYAATTSSSDNTEKSIECRLSTENSVIYRAVKKSFNNSSYYYTVVHSMATRRSVGFTGNGKLIQMEADYGVTLQKDPTKANKTLLYVNAYNHTNQKLTVKSATVEGLGKDNDMKKTLNVSFTEKKFETSSYKTGLYRITVEFSNKKQAEIFFYKVTGNVAPCVVEKMSNSQLKTFRDRRTALKDAMNEGGVERDGSNSLALDKFYYPVYNFNSKYRCDTQLWINQSDKIVKSDWSDEYKAYMIYEWVISNIAYDNFKSNEGDYSRAHDADNYTGAYSVWNIRTGVCFDITNILTIMFRAQGIPATSIYSKSSDHIWNAVYINGRWVELDGSYCARYKTLKADYTQKTQKAGENLIYSTMFTVYPNSNRTMPEDAVAGAWLMYGDPNDPNSRTHYRH